mmetsp:Transcript_36301/g.107878  ORF Transcript_36301/g.107878 Transcript_36301/m.107878 type:complete len:201 (-) Transcript_36301:175-777(-)
MAPSRVLALLGLAMGANAANILRQGRALAPKDSAENPPSWRPTDGEVVFTHATDGQEVHLGLEVPNTFSKFMEGLMYRKEITDDEGMLFQWQGDGRRSFWMENTYIDLDIIYTNVAGNIVSIKQAKKLDLHGVPSDGEAQDAIEVPMGWCERNGVKIGDRVKLNINTQTYFVARDMPQFGATEEEVAAATAAGVFDAFAK